MNRAKLQARKQDLEEFEREHKIVYENLKAERTLQLEQQREK
jgi:hypothetical protein